jgi:alcohol dehydrogenase class IV
VFADPELTFDLPPHVTAATGMDALTHNVESYIAKGYHPMCDGIALEGLRIAARALPLAVREPKNLQARSDMLMASMMGAVAFQKDLGATHSCAHALSTVADLHHGLANGIMIDYVMRFNQPVEIERFAHMAQAAGVARGSTGASAQAFVEWLTALKREVGIPAKLGAVNVTREHLPKLLDVAVEDICHKTNPRPCSREDFAHLFEQAL